MSDAHTDQSRAEFEHWVMRNPRPGTHLDRSRNGEYKDNRVKAKWAAWQAALNYAIASTPAEAAPVEAGLRDCVVPTTEQSSGVELPEPQWHKPSPMDAAHFPYYTPEQVRTLLAGVKDSLTVAPAVPQGWIAVGERLPEPGRPVLLDIGKKHPIRATWVARFTLEAGDDDPDWGEYDEDGDMYYCPQGWYEWNEHEDTHWRVHADPIRWAELPQPPKEQT